MAKRHQRHTAPPRQTRTRTRQNRGAALVTDPIQNTQLLNDQLRALGLYAAPTLGDGNCLFRALADQYYGSPSQHLKLREEICNWMEAHKQRYAPFVDDERGLDVHLRCMRQQGTYGGHLELTAFSHLKRRDVKVIQPGLVYVIEWTSGADLSPTSPVMPVEEDVPQETAMNDRDTRRSRREKKKNLKDKPSKVKHRNVDDDHADPEEGPSTLGAVYVAYHDWEHFSSVRNLSGPHSGLPYVVEKPQAPAKSKGKSAPPPLQSSESSESLQSESSPDVDLDAPSPNGIPLPLSRSSSPPPSSEASTSASSSLSVPPLPGYNCPPDAPPKLSLRINRSPKRALDESYQNAEDSQGEAKRSRSNLRHLSKMDVDPDADTPSLMASGSSAESTSSSSPSSPVGTPPPSMVVVPPTPILASKPLTRRQRKALGLPASRSGSASPVPGKSGKAGVGKIVVPGGRFKKQGVASVKTANDDDDGIDAEWAKNGTGRVDVRGFKELKI